MPYSTKTIEKIEGIIAECRYGDELFFTDTKKAAMNIIKYLESVGFIVKKEAVLVKAA